MKIIAAIFYTALLAVLLLVCREIFQFQDWDMFLWGGAFYLFVGVTVILAVCVAGMLLIDRYLKNRFGRIVSVGILAVCFVMTLVRYRFIWKINRMDEEAVWFLYPELLTERSFPLPFQLVVWAALGILLAVLIKRIVKMNNLSK